MALISSLEYNRLIKNIDYDTRLKDIPLYDFYKGILSVLRDHKTKVPNITLDRDKTCGGVRWYTAGDLDMVPMHIKRELDNSKEMDFEISIDERKNWLFVHYYIVRK